MMFMFDNRLSCYNYLAKEITHCDGMQSFFKVKS